MKPNIGLMEKDSAAVIKILNQHVADLYVLYTKTRNYHWNVVGEDFSEMHKFFEQQYEALNDTIDDVAERARALGGKSVATLTEFVKMSRLPEHPKKFPNTMQMVKDLLTDHEAVIRNLRKDIDETADKYHDMGTSDFLTGLLEAHEKMAWMLRSFLER